VALVSGAILAMPVILHQLWLFIVPALEVKEKR
jgi:Sec-independent protein secretion pathway component TatC